MSAELLLLNLAPLSKRLPRLQVHVACRLLNVALRWTNLPGAQLSRHPLLDLPLTLARSSRVPLQ